jgi:G:T-mismatch repair DNA endonuclease (very short patch repair protein)
VDVVSSVKHSEMMSGIRGLNTRPELQVRARLHRFRWSVYVLISAA